MKRMRISLAALAAALLAGLLAGCGGGGGDVGESPPPTAAGSDVPQSALASAQAYTDYVGSIPVSDTAGPLSLGSFDAPVSDDTAPSTVQ